MKSLWLQGFFSMKTARVLLRLGIGGFFLLSANLNSALAKGMDGEASLKSVQKNLSRFSKIEGVFRQDRTIKDLDVHLKSEGSFEFEKRGQLSWRQDKPFKQELTLTKSKMVQKDANGNETVLLAEKVPVVFSMSSSFLGIFSGDESQFNKQFLLKTTWHNQEWSLVLTPQDQILSKAIVEIQIFGDIFVKKIYIVERSGNTTSIEFSKIKGL